MIVVGVDPGLDGAIVAVQEGTEHILASWIMPTFKGKRREYDVQRVVSIFQELKDTADRGSFEELVHTAGARRIIVNVEAPGKFSKGTLAVASTNFCAGMLQGVLTSLKLPFRLVRAKDWQKQILRGYGQDTKQASILWATRKYPEHDFRRSERSKTPHDGLCDALGLAHYRPNASDI